MCSTQNKTSLKKTSLDIVYKSNGNNVPNKQKISLLDLYKTDSIRQAIIDIRHRYHNRLKNHIGVNKKNYIYQIGLEKHTKYQNNLYINTINKQFLLKSN